MALITKLDSVVNASFPKIGELEFDINVPAGVEEANRRFFYEVMSGYTAYVRAEGGTFNNGLTEATISGSGYITLSEGSYKIFVGNKKYIYQLSKSVQISGDYIFIGDNFDLSGVPVVLFNWRGAKAVDGFVNLKQLKGSNIATLQLANATLLGDFTDLVCQSKLSILNFAGSSVSAKTEDIGVCNKLTELYVANSPVSGDVSNLGGCVKLAVLSALNNTTLSGDIADMFDAMCAAGRTSGTCYVDGTNTNLKFNGNSFVTKTATFSGGTWS